MGQKQKKQRLTKEEARNRIKPTQDLFVRWLFGEESHTSLTKSFINAVLEDAGGKKVREISIKSPFIMSECRSTKMPVTDIEASDENGTVFDIEIQAYTENAFLLRLKYYWAGIYRKQLKKGNDYSTLKPCIVIALTTKKIFTESTKLHYISQTVDKEDGSLLFFRPFDPEQYHIIELERFENNPDAMYTVNRDGRQRKISASLFSWLRFLKLGAEEDFMKKYHETDTAIAEAKQHYETFIDDDALALAQLRRDRADHDLAQFRNDAIREGLAEGREKGLTEGRAEGRAEIVRKLLKAGISAGQIAAATGMDIEEIKKG